MRQVLRSGGQNRLGDFIHTLESPELPETQLSFFFCPIQVMPTLQCRDEIYFIVCFDIIFRSLLSKFIKAFSFLPYKCALLALGVLAKFQFEQLITFQCSALPAVSDGKDVFFVFLENCRVKQLVAASLEESRLRSGEKASCFFEGAAC